jgi:hypothetical protein
MLQLSSSLEENLAALNARFGASADFYAKRIELYHCPGAIVLFDNMASLESLWSLLLDAATRHTPSLQPERTPHTGTQVYDLLMNHSGLPAEDSPVKDMDDLIRRMTNLSLNDIGKEFGDRDHTTVLHSLDKVEKQMRTDPAFAEVVKEITTNINAKR